MVWVAMTNVSIFTADLNVQTTTALPSVQSNKLKAYLKTLREETAAKIFLGGHVLTLVLTDFDRV